LVWLEQKGAHSMVAYFVLGITVFAILYAVTILVDRA
jgi:hypothetical protein